jgi:glycosyltransferase involved in cell wall biosynthesis
MRVAFVAPRTVHHRETPATARLDWVARSLVERGHEVAVLCTRWWGSGAVDEFEKEGVTYRAVAGEGAGGRSFALRLPMALRRVGPDVVHADGGAAGAVRAARYGAKLARAPLVAEFYDDDPRAGDGPAAVRSATGLVAPSRMVRTHLREAGADGDDVSVIPDPVDVDLVRSTPPDEEYEDDVVYARDLDAASNLESVLLALAELRGYDWSATVVGDGPAREDYERQARDLRIDDRVRFVGEASRTERVGIYRAARAFVQTARKCAFATELLWALACGCVGIVEYHADSSAHELVEGRERGVRTTDETELTDAIRGAGDHEAATFDDDFVEFDGDAVVERYLALYRDLAGR